MQQPTPAPSEYPSSPPPARPRASRENVAAAEDHPITYIPPPPNVESAPFYVLSSLFDKLSTERKPEKRKKLLGSWFNHWREEKGYDLYPVLRLILPQKDRERSVYGLKEKNIAKIYIKLIPLGRNDPDAIRMLNWKKPTERDASSGDFPTVLYEVVSKRSSVIEGSLSIDELNETLDQLSENMGHSDRQAKIMQRVYNRTTPEEQRWIVRIILKDMIISVKETTVFAVFHPDAHDLYNTCSDLKKVAWDLWDPTRRLKEEEKEVKLFRSFAPMLCKRPTQRIEQTVKEMGGGKFFIEEKLDGERMQLHKRGNEYFYCSRKGKDYTYLYGKHVGIGSLTPFIDNAFDPRIEDIILDGEMLVWDPVSERNLPFGTLKTAALNKSKKDINPRPCFKVFDLLYLNGTSLLHKSLKFRKRNLKSCIAEVKGRIEFSLEYEGRTAQDVRNRMEDIMAQRGEGLVLKHPSSEYILNGRNRDWIKVKPEYMDNMGETVDVLVVAGNYGTGRRSGGVSTLICAVLNDRPQNEDDDEPKYSSFVRIGSGFTFTDYMWIRQKPWKEWDPKNPPSFLEVSKKGQDDKGDIYLEPEDSFVIKVKAAEITASDQYHMGYTMRFPRALMIRDDLSPADCMTASAVMENVRSVKKRKMSADEGDGKKKRRVVAKKPTLLPEYQGISLKDIEAKSDLFSDMKFTYDLKLVMNKGDVDIIRPQWLTDSVARGDLAPLKKKYFFHATIKRMEDEEYNMDDDDDEEIPMVASPTPDSNTEETTPKASSEVDKMEEDIDPSLADWFKIDEKDIPSKSEVRKEETDSETEPDSDNEDVQDKDVDLEEADDDWENVPSVKMGEEEEAMEYDQELIFKHLCFYLDSPENAQKNGMSVKSGQESDVNERFAALSRLITKNGGKLVDLDEPKLTHILLDKRDTSRRLELMKRTSKPKRRHLVVGEFIQACIDEATLLDEDGTHQELFLWLQKLIQISQNLYLDIA
ncbi:hypothetical protein EW026_g3144 [Hermanssonia centrifuga]|uniref:DNA ligase n=1 Tax=Hermanssonia centrifuga TaxID=98765 RepID=A0A4S4KL33_9APHY|nr:hypothetical protein EW026_g3144 [Hermanssonia centrifuga]